MRRMRLLALFLDVLVCALAADAAGLALTFVIWRYRPGALAWIPWIWTACGLAAVLAFLLRDRQGGRARRWLALEARRPDGRAPGAWGSIRRNMPLLVPFWNLYDAWPVRGGRRGAPAHGPPYGNPYLAVLMRVGGSKWRAVNLLSRFPLVKIQMSHA